jgi:ATP-dependent Clp protease ATP-binding subunit ClpA
LTFTGEAGTVMETTLRVALSLLHNYIGTEHILLAILESDTNEARQLNELGLTAEVARAKVLDRLAKLSG